MMLNILGKKLLQYRVTNSWLSILTVIHGYVQSASTVARNTGALKEALSDIANLHYVDGPLMDGTSSRPWWILDNDLEHDTRAVDRWDDVVCFLLNQSSWWTYR
jgi:hypothetical protein